MFYSGKTTGSKRKCCFGRMLTACILRPIGQNVNKVSVSSKVITIVTSKVRTADGEVTFDALSCHRYNWQSGTRLAHASFPSSCFNRWAKSRLAQFQLGAELFGGASEARTATALPVLKSLPTTQSRFLSPMCRHNNFRSTTYWGRCG